MTKHFFLFLLIFSFFTATGQHKVVNSKTKEPIPYAHVKLANKQKGTIANFSGIFNLDSTFSNLDTVIISCIGYENKSFLIKDLKTNSIIELAPNAQQLPEVVISTKKIKYKTKKLGVTKKPNTRKRFLNYAGIANNGEQRAIWIPNVYSITGILKSINIYVSDFGYPDAHFRIHVYECSPFETKPGKELINSNIIASATKGNEWVKIDMSKEKIRIQENGCFIGIEWFDSTKSKGFKDSVLAKGNTFNNGKRKDTIYSRVINGNGAVLGEIHQKYRDSKNKLWHKKDDTWHNRGVIDEKKFYTTQTLADGTTFNRTPDNHLQAVLCINIDVDFLKDKIELVYDSPKKRRLNKIEKVKRDLFKYPQSNISELFSSLIKAFENEEIIYMLKHLCVYKKGELNNILNDLNITKNEEYILSKNERLEIVEYLKVSLKQLDLSILNKINNKHYELKIGNDLFNLTVDKGLWKINPYSYKIYK